MKNEQVDTENHKKISFTADHHPYFRFLGEFPFAEDIEKAVNGKVAFQREVGQDMAIIPAFEARCRSTNEVIRKYVEEKGIRQILSIAAGMEQRGIEFASSYPDLVYVETDISNVFETKKVLADKIFAEHNLPNRNGLHFEVADVFSLEQLKKATHYFSKDKQILVVNEGLLAYYSEEENRRISRNIRDLISSFGGVWVTPDPSMNKVNRDAFFVYSPTIKASQAKIAERTGRNYDKMGFEDDSQALDLFESESFSVKRYYRKDLGYSLVTLGKVGLNEANAKEFDNTLKERFAVWVMSPK